MVTQPPTSPALAMINPAARTVHATPLHPTPAPPCSAPPAYTAAPRARAAVASLATAHARPHPTRLPATAKAAAARQHPGASVALLLLLHCFLVLLRLLIPKLLLKLLTLLALAPNPPGLP